MAVGEGFVTREAFGIFSRNLDRRIGSLEVRLSGAGFGGGGGGIPPHFTNLFDVPHSYSTYALRHVRVNTGETGLEFAEKITVSDQPPSGGSSGDVWLRYDDAVGHALLSAAHLDTLADSVLAGDLIYGNSTPKWARKAKGTDGQFLKMVSGYPGWAAHGLSYGDVGAAASGHIHASFDSPTLVIDSVNHRIGIGTISPATLLQIGTPGTTLGAVRFSGNVHTGNEGYLLFNHSVGGGYADSHIAKLLAVAGDASPFNSLQFFVGAWNNNADVGTAKMSIVSSGNVGIGTTSPGARLSLGSAIANTKFAVYDSGGYFAGFGIQSDEFRFHGTANSMNFRFYDAPAGNALMTIKGTGNVGIGTIDPKSRLHVVGLSIYANNAAAIAGGLTAGAFYRLGGDPDYVCVVH